MTSRMSIAFLAALLAACGGAEVDEGDGTGDGDESCGDPDGSGGDTGDVPNVLGLWTSTFGTHLYDDNDCNLEGLGVDDFDWLTGNMEVGGRIPDRLTATFDGDDENLMWGVENAYGGIAFTGSRVMEGHTVYATVGGHLFDVPQLERKEIRGFGYVGVDIDSEDTAIDCWLQGDFWAKKSGN